MHQNEQTIDINTLIVFLRSHKQLDRVGGAQNIQNIVTSAWESQAYNLEAYAKLIQEAYLRRELIKRLEILCMEAHNPQIPVDQLFEKAEQEVFEICQQRLATNVKPEFLRAVAKREVEEITHAVKNHIKPSHFLTGYAEFDKTCVSMNPGKLIVIAGRPAQGKTAFAINLAWNFAEGYKGLVMPFFSLEMDRAEIAGRFLSLATDINSIRFQKLDLNPNQLTSLGNSLPLFDGNNIILDDTPGIKFNAIKSKVKQMAAQIQRMGTEARMGPIFIDYLQLLTASDRFDEITEISRQAKILARELQVPVCLISQLSRAVEQRNDKRPMMSDLRGSGAIEQDADMIIFLFRDQYYNPETADQGIAEIIIGKQRGGPTGTTKLLYEAQTGQFLPMPEVPHAVSIY